MRTGLLTVVAAVLFLAAADYANREIRIAFNRQSMADLARNTLSRVEIATDYALIRLGEIYQRGYTDCRPAAIEALDDAVFRSGSIKDILMASGGMMCSAAPHNRTLAKHHVTPVDGVPARNPNIVLNPLRMADTPAMAVTWKFDDQAMATALVNTESLVFDVLSPELRETGAIKLSLTNGRTVGSFEGLLWEIGGDTEMFEVQSSRFPLVVRIHIPTTLLTDLHMGQNVATNPAAIALALLLAYLVARGLVPPENASGHIRQALTRGEIVPHFQPIYNLRSGAITGFEVLARWSKPDGTSVSPGFFVPQIEANGWSNDLLETMVRQTAQSMRDVIRDGSNPSFGFNVSPGQITEKGFSDRLLDLLERCGFDVRRVVLEITEREVIGDTEAAGVNIGRLKAAGIQFAIDDTGTGHNGLASIRTLGAEILKIDKFFVDGIEHDPRSATLVRMLVSVARDYGMRVVAEGVEHGAQLEALTGLGVDAVQGFYLCHPLDAAEATLEYARHQAVLMRTQIHPDESGEPDAESVRPDALTA